MLQLVDAFLPSRDEASGILGGWPGPREAARELARLGAPLVCVKLGTGGSIGYRAADGALVELGAAEAHPVDPTGCGDAFCGGFLVGLAETDDLRSALANGTVAAGFAAADHGAAHMLVPDRAETNRRAATSLGSKSRGD